MFSAVIPGSSRTPDICKPLLYATGELLAQEHRLKWVCLFCVQNTPRCSVTVSVHTRGNSVKTAAAWLRSIWFSEMFQWQKACIFKLLKDDYFLLEIEWELSKVGRESIKDNDYLNSVIGK